MRKPSLARKGGQPSFGAASGKSLREGDSSFCEVVYPYFTNRKRVEQVVPHPIHGRHLWKSRVSATVNAEQTAVQREAFLAHDATASSSAQDLTHPIV